MVRDLPPSPAQSRLLSLLSDGFEVALHPDGSYRVRQTEEPVSRQMLAACLSRRWITDMPGLPLFDQECRLTRWGLRPWHATRVRLA